MPENRPVRTVTAPVVRRKKKRSNPFKLSLILMFYVVSIIVSFLIYANNFDISSKPSPTYNGGAPKQEPVIVTDSEGASVTDAEGNMVVEMSDIEESREAEGINPVPESEAQPESYLESCMFIGDSITTGLSVYKLVPSDNVLADVGLRVDKINETTVKNTRFDEPVKVMTALEEVRPANIYILLGTNGVAWYNNDSMIEQYGAFVDDIKTKLPDSKIYIISLTPVGTMKENIDTVENGKVLNSEIDQFNARLLDLANQKNVYYVDVNSELKDASGKLPDDVTRDGMHFTLDVYKKFVNYILTHTAK
ncbi:MAG: hypothetical protein IJL67_05540 [Oscillospiraceae bacterium]|nr:hypothetical protein [Oscillospiraceae bacterium]